MMHKIFVLAMTLSIPLLMSCGAPPSLTPDTGESTGKKSEKEVQATQWESLTEFLPYPDGYDPLNLPYFDPDEPVYSLDNLPNYARLESTAPHMRALLASRQDISVFLDYKLVATGEKYDALLTVEKQGAIVSQMRMLGNHIPNRSAYISDDGADIWIISNDIILNGSIRCSTGYIYNIGNATPDIYVKATNSQIENESLQSNTWNNTRQTSCIEVSSGDWKYNLRTWKITDQGLFYKKTDGESEHE